MQYFNEHHHGDLILEDDLEMSGLVSGTVTVPSGKYLRLIGLIAGDLIVERNGRADIYGMVNGTIRNNDGQVEIFGIVDQVHDLGDRKSVINNRAVIRKPN